LAFANIAVFRDRPLGFWFVVQRLAARCVRLLQRILRRLFVVIVGHLQVVFDRDSDGVADSGAANMLTELVGEFCLSR
jgi:hypothetical protein